jgi:hypothetical protein
MNLDAFLRIRLMNLLIRNIPITLSNTIPNATPSIILVTIIILLDLIDVDSLVSLELLRRLGML